MVIKVYSTPSCPYCTLLKDYLKEKKISFEDYNVSEDHEKAQEMVRISGQMGVPVTVIAKDEKDEEPAVIVGFDKETLEKIISNYSK